MKCMYKNAQCCVTLLGFSVLLLVLAIIHTKRFTRSFQDDVRVQPIHNIAGIATQEHLENARPDMQGNHVYNQTAESHREINTNIHEKCPSDYRHFTKTDMSGYTDLLQVSAYTLSNRTMQFDKKIAILTPVSNFAGFLVHYFQLLCSLTYPHHLITVVLGEDSSLDNTFNVAVSHAEKLAKSFRDIRVVRFNHTMPENTGFGKHDEFFQKKRRGHLAKARNMLLFEGIGDADIVLWIDADIIYFPPDLVQHLVGENKDIVVPACMFENHGNHKFDVYDRNSWQETNRSLENLKHFDEDHLKLEGYTRTMRLYLPDIKSSSHIVPLDGVGGCVLMIRADCHRKGLIFPTFVFRNHIETEGLAKMAAKMDFGVYGLPQLQVVHW